MSPSSKETEPLLARCRHWIFDMDGTLTVAIHDFDALRSTLGLPPGQPILEAIAELPPEEQSAKHARLDELELELAAQGRAAPGAAELLQALVERKVRLGILTRNNRRNVMVTLQAAGLDDFFFEADIIAREDAPPKPDPGGVRLLVERWRSDPAATVMVGDYLFDLLAARAAGCLAAYVDVSGQFPYRADADLSVGSLSELSAHW